MSQAGDIDVTGSHPDIPTEFVANVGSAVPIANVLEILGDIVAAHGVPLETVASGNTVTIDAQFASETATTDATKVGMAAFDSSGFDVDANGFVTLVGGGTAATNLDVDAHTAPGTDPVVPNGSGNIVITGAQVAAGVVGTNVIRSDSLAANSVTIEIQRTTTSASTDVTKNGVCHFDSAAFGVDANGFVTLAGGGLAIDSIAVQTGTSPIVPTVAGLVTINGAVVAAGTNPVRSDGTGANTLALEVQRSQAIAATDATKVGLAVFDSAAFDVDANGFVQLNNGGIAATSFDVQANTVPGTDPVVPTALGVVTVNGAAVANHSVVLETRSRAANAYNVEVQYATSAAATDATKSGVAHFDSTDFTVDANGFVALAGGGAGQTITGQSGGALVPTAGNWNIYGGTTAAGTSPVTTSGSGSTLTTNVQRSQSLASADATKVGLANFDSASFSVDANGFVTASGTGLAKTITGDSGGALSPTAGNWNILGLSGSKTSGSGSTLTIKSPPYADSTAATLTVNSGTFATAAGTYTLPASPAVGDLVEIVCITTGIVVTANTGQKIQISGDVSSTAGTATNSAKGDALCLRYRATDAIWYSTSSPGVWVLA